MLAVALCLATGAGATTVCRPNALGDVTCLGTAELPPPRPFPPATPIEEIRARPEAQSDLPRFVPARRVDRLGSTLVDGPVGAPCRADALGNLRCR